MAVSDIAIDPVSDSIWILTSTFMIFTMQSGFGLLESGSVSVKNEVNIMVKNAVDVIFGGLTYWMFGYGLSFGDVEPYSNPFCGWGYFFVHANETEIGWVYSKFFFQASFATTATTIVSGSMAERTRLEAYIIFSMLNSFIFCFPAHWIWAAGGWLHSLGVIDIAGAGPVHVVGGVTGFVATIMLKPRHARFSSKEQPVMGSPTNAILGMFMLWWGWLGFNCGSTFGISGLKWKLAARSAVSTILASIAGGIVGFLLSYIFKDRRFDVAYIINALLGSLVGITATCALSQPWQAFIIGGIGGIITIACVETLNKLKIDDPVGCIGTHGAGGIWSLLAGGLFTQTNDLTEAIQLSHVKDGLFVSGKFYQLGVQTLAIVVIIGWTVVTSFLFLKLVDLLIGLRVPLEEEILGADIVEHAVGGLIYDKKEKRLLNCNREDNREIDELQYISQMCKGRERDSLVVRTSSFGSHSFGFRSSQRRAYRYSEQTIKRKKTGKDANTTLLCFGRKQSAKRRLHRVRAKEREYVEEINSDTSDEKDYFPPNDTKASPFVLPYYKYDFPDLPFRKADSKSSNSSMSGLSTITYL